MRKRLAGLLSRMRGADASRLGLAVSLACAAPAAALAAPAVFADQSLWPSLATALVSFVMGGFATAIGNLFRARASMAELVDKRIRLLIDGYERRIEDLQDEIKRLENKIDDLTAALDDARRSGNVGL